MRLPVIDPVRSYGICENPFGDDDDVGAGWYVWELDPVRDPKPDLLPFGPFASAEEAQAELKAFLEEGF